MRFSDIVRAAMGAARRDGNVVASVNSAAASGRPGGQTRTTVRSRRRIVQRDGRTIVDEASSTRREDHA